jgi:hypothetical protein
MENLYHPASHSPQIDTSEQHKACDTLRQNRLVYIMHQLFDMTRKKRDFLLVLLSLVLLATALAPYPSLARWFAFMVASYSAIANDSIQTLGTLIASHGDKKWWYLWLFIGLIFVATILYSWMVYHGDVSYQRLTEKGLSEAPKSFSFLQLFAPIVLLILTHWRIPVSTSFLLLNVFATDTGTLLHVLHKSFYGYFIAFLSAFFFWMVIAKIVNKHASATPWRGWIALQWLASGALWSVWIMQDASNIAVFLPRQLNILELCCFIGFVFFGLGLLFALRGDRMQKVLSEKSDLTDVRAGTLVNLVYMLILAYFENMNNVPMSTTWVFIGLLGGRELAISLSESALLTRKEALSYSMGLIKKDLQKAFLGLLIAIGLSFAANPVMRNMLMGFLRTWLK